MNTNSEDESIYTENIMNSVREALIIIDENLRVVSANRSFYQQFHLSKEQTENRYIHELGNGQWNLPKLRHLLQKVILHKASVNNLELKHRFEEIGERTILLDARPIIRAPHKPSLILLTIDDVTDQRESLRRIEESELKYHTFVENLNSIIIEFDRSGAITFFNHFSEKLFGYRRDEVYGKPFVGTIIPLTEKSGRNNSHIPEEIFENTQKYYINENEGICKDGSRIWFSWSAKAMRNSSGQTSEILIDGTDLTQFVLTREQFAEKTRMLDTLLDFIPEGIMITDNNHNVQKVSRYLGKLLGIEACRLQQPHGSDCMTMFEFYLPNGKRITHFKDLPLSKAAETAQQFTDYEITLKQNGTKKILSINASPIFDTEGNVIGAIGVWRDTTEYRTYMAEIQQRKQVLDAIMKYAPIGIMLVDKNGKITDVSRHQALLLGIHEKDIIGKKEQPEQWGVLKPSTRKALKYHFMPLCRAIRKRKVITDEEYLLVQNETDRMVALSAGPILDERKKVSGGVAVWRDITERKIVEKTLRESEKRFRAAIDNYISTFIIYDSNRRIQYINKTGLQVIGLTEEQVLGHTDEEIIPEEITRHYIPYLLNAITAKEKQHLEFTYTLNGIQYANIIDYVPLLDNGGDVYQILGITVDITDRKKTEEQLQHKTAYLEATINSIPDGYIIYNSDGTIFRMNSLAQEVLGFTEEDKTLSHKKRMNMLKVQTINGEPFPFERIPSHRAMKGEIVRDEILKIKRPTRDYWLSVSASPIITNEGTMLGVVMKFADVSRLYELQEQYAKERNFVDAILQTSGALITVLDTTGRIIRFNKACEQLTGYTADEVHNRRVFELFIPDDEMDGINEVLIRLYAGEQMVEHENHWFTKSGEKRFIRWRNSVMLDEHGQISFAIATGIDISDRKRLEEELNLRARELVAVNRDLESFSYSVSHDLREPVNIIGGYATILLQDYKERLEEDAQNYLKRIETSVQKMQQLIDDLLNLSRISRHEIKREDVDLSTMVYDYLQELKLSQPLRQAEFIIEDNIHANADPRLIAVALENLLRNAWKFTSKKIITRIEFRTVFIEGERVFIIRDNGAGFDSKFWQTIFEPFKRMHSEKEFGGTGIGLSIVQRIINRHGGKIWAEGAVGRGAAFYFTL